MAVRAIAALVAFSAILTNGAAAQGVPGALIGNWCEPNGEHVMTSNGTWEEISVGRFVGCRFSSFSPPKLARAQTTWTSRGMCHYQRAGSASASWHLSDQGALTVVLNYDNGQRQSRQFRRC